MLILSAISAIFYIFDATLRGHLSPTSSWFFMPDGGMLQPAVMDNASKRKPVVHQRDITFHLWTRKNPLEQQQMFIAGNLSDYYYSSSRPTKILIHGFNTDGLRGDWILKMKDAYLVAGDYNVISVNWHKLARLPLYHSAVMYTKDVGIYTAKFIDVLVAKGSSLSNFHLIGFSLGAHAAGYMASHLASGKVARITGLDPALPAFTRAVPSSRLDPNDAVFVDVIHTNGKASRYAKGLGYMAPLGHADFYPNGGNLQPGCRGGTFGDDITGCSHTRAHRYFLESISDPTGFLSLPCPDYPAFKSGQCGNCSTTNGTCVVMGAHTSTSASGNYYLRTSDVSPYGKIAA